MTRSIVRSLALGLSAMAVLAVSFGAASTALAATLGDRLAGKHGNPNFSVFEKANGAIAVRRFEVKQLPVTCRIDDAKAFAAEMRIVVWRELAVDPRTRNFAGTQRTVTNELDGLPESASSVTTRVKGKLGQGGHSGEGAIRLRSRGVQLVPDGRIVSVCETAGWLPWRASK